MNIMGDNVKVNTILTLRRMGNSATDRAFSAARTTCAHSKPLVAEDTMQRKPSDFLTSSECHHAT